MDSGAGHPADRGGVVARMGQELRAPLTSILGFGELLVSSDLPPLPASYAQALVEAARHLQSLLDDVIDLTRVEAGELALMAEPVDLQPLLEDVQGLLRPVANAHGVTLEQQGGSGFVLADRQRLREVLVHLVTNAITYNHPGGRVHLSVSERADGRTRVSVTDTGRGVDPADQARLFVPFERLDAGRTGTQGSGLGLALARELTRAMGGELGLTSEPGRGSTFWVELAAAEPSALQAGRAPVDAVRMRSYGRAMTVLYVEDLAMNVQLVESILRWRPDVRLVSAMLGELALDLARQDPPDLVLLDLHLPDLAGKEVLRRLRADRVTAQVPVVVFSADASPHLPAELEAAGADGYLTKPIGVRELLAALDALLVRQDAAGAAPS